MKHSKKSNQDVLLTDRIPRVADIENPDPHLRFFSFRYAVQHRDFMMVEEIDVKLRVVI